jgi:outer membrane receptor protein involved in Fe transport
MNRKLHISILVAVGLAFLATTAHAQTSTTGAIRGTVEDQAGQPVVGATVIVTSPALQGQQADLTEGDGTYYVSNLAPGTYMITVFYANKEFQRTNVPVRVGKTAVANVAVNADFEGERIVVEDRAPIIDQGSTKTGLTIDNDFTQNVPTGRTFGAVLETAAGSQGDLYGTSFGGSTSAENIYIVEGLNTTDPAYGVQSTNLPNEFISETEVITGGYNAEYGRATGGVINVVTKSGSNEFHGSVFSYYTPGFLRASAQETPSAASSIDAIGELDYQWDLGAELGGPIVKDKLWFHVGVNPSFSNSSLHRVINTRVDADGDGVPDVDPETGFLITEEVDRFTFSRPSRTVYFTGKLTGAVAPEHQGQLSFFGNPSSREAFPYTVTGVERAGRFEIDSGAMDIAGKWTSKFNDNKTQVDAVIGWHRNVHNETPALDGGGDPQVRFGPTAPLTDYSDYETAFGGVPAACDDADPNDPYPMITNCPVTNYNVGGIGFRETQTTDRLSAKVSATQRVKAAGHHAFKAGVDIEHQTYDHLSDFSGGTRYLLLQSGVWRVDRFFTVRDDGMQPCGSDIDQDGTPDANCTFQPDGLLSNTTTQNIGAFVQDSWSIMPNLTFNAGIRWEQQTLFVGEEVQGQISPTTGEPIPEVAFKISDMFAPRVGLIYDWTKEGRSKVFGHYGRFYESIPMDINARAYGGEVFNVNVLLPSDGMNTCDPQGTGCDPDGPLALANLFFGGGEELVTPGLGGQYLDEGILGAEYELLPDFKVGASVVHRSLGRVIEDVSTDGANTYIIANPGEVDEGAVADLRAEADAIEASDPARAEFLRFQADMYEGVGIFDEPNRVYNALQLTAEKRFARDLMVRGSYTLSRLRGNFPGLFSPETGQLDPNLTSMYDLPELMANRYGPLAADRTHLLKIDGYYILAREGLGQFVFGSSIRAQSGIPHNTLGSHSLYGGGESYILPRGTADASPFMTQLDLKVAYGRKLGKQYLLEAFFDVFNVLNTQTEVDADEIYTFENVNPIVGGTEEDLRHLKALNPATDLPTNRVAEVNPNFGNVVSRQAPLTMRFGVRLTF